MARNKQWFVGVLESGKAERVRINPLRGPYIFGIVCEGANESREIEKTWNLLDAEEQGRLITTSAAFRQ